MLLNTKNIYNDNININMKQISFDEITSKSYKKNFIDDITYQNLLGKYQEALAFEVIDSEEENIEETIRNFMFYIDNYLTSFETPYDAFDALINKEVKILLKEAKGYTISYQKQVEEKIANLYEESKYMYNNYKLYKDTLIACNNIIQNKKTLFYYTPMCNDEVVLKNIVQIDDLISAFKVEMSIINKFNQEDVLRIISSLNHDYSQNWKNVLESVLYNYVYSSLYLDNPNLHFSIDTYKIVLSEMINKNYSIDDFIDIIENGKIKFSDSEKEYIYNNFISELKKYMNSKETVYMFVKN